MTEHIICECGMVIKGTSDKHVASNLVQHKKSKMHSELMETKKLKKKGEKKENDTTIRKD